MSENMPQMDQKDLDYFESLLLEKRRELVASQAEGDARNQKDLGSGLAGYSNHLADTATDYTALETTFDLQAREGKHLVYIEEALLRIKEKTYGVCKVCHKLIPKARLEAVPIATKCVNCKEQVKKKERDENRMEMARAFAEQHRMEQANGNK